MAELCDKLTTVQHETVSAGPIERAVALADLAARQAERMTVVDLS